MNPADDGFQQLKKFKRCNKKFAKGLIRGNRVCCASVKQSPNSYTNYFHPLEKK